MSMAAATKAQRYALYQSARILVKELQQYVQGLQAKAPDSAYNTSVNAMVDDLITKATAVKNAS